MRKKKYYNNGIENRMIKVGDPIPEGFVPGMCPRSGDDVKLSNEKRKQTNLKKYGVSVPLQSKEIKEKTKNTCIAKYGVENPSQAEEIKERRKETYLEKYGVENPMKCEEIKERLRKSNLERYGVENPFQVEEIKEKIREVNLENLGVPYPMMSENVKEKSKKTLFNNYGISSPMKSNEIKDRTKQTCLEKYGVEWACQRPEARIGSNNSVPNIMFEKLLKSKRINYEREFTVGRYSYDFKIGNILVEIDPTYTHNQLWSPFGSHKGKDKFYHKDKSLKAEEYSYRCIHVFDWDDVDKIISLLKHREKIYARKCEIREVCIKDCNLFLSKHHLQGTCRGQEVRLGLYYENELVSLMTFGKPRYNKNYEWELLRFSSCKLVLGGEDKLFKRFLREYNPKSIISYCDRAKFDGNIYKSLGFERKSTSTVSKHWYSPKEKRHITDNLLRQRGYDQLFNEYVGKGSDNESLIIERGYLPVYDCGQDVWIYVK